MGTVRLGLLRQLHSWVTLLDEIHAELQEIYVQICVAVLSPKPTLYVVQDQRFPERHNHACQLGCQRSTLHGIEQHLIPA